jgi:CxxC motif-containing protein
MIRTLTCIVCPVGCDMVLTLADQAAGSPEILAIEGAGCQRGRDYAAAELQNPLRIVTSSVLVIQGDQPLASVRLTRPIPREKIPAIMAILRQLRIQAPVAIGQVIMHNILDLDSDVIATRHVAARICTGGC